MSGDEPAIEGREEDRPALDVACFDPLGRFAALVSTTGNHCQVWRSTRKRMDGDGDESRHVEYVIKYPTERLTMGEARILFRQYRMLRKALGDIVPRALFVVSEIDGRENLLVLAQAVNVWFNIANPLNREEAIGLLREHPLAWAQLKTFVSAAQAWREGDNPRVIDLFGLDNLVMDNQRQIRYVDSFYVFFFEDMLHMLGGEPDDELEEKIATSLRRLAYLQEILAFSDPEG
ncbi:MAG: hypothetical protein KDI82_09665 [Gammaproteobacteria bacterium]|nr:hypothetical protein [Gammaproteobacteria bacterium]